MSFTIPVYIQPNSSRNEIVGEHNNMLKVKIKSPAEGGKANKELVKFIAQHLEIKIRQIAIVKGLVTRQKTILLDIDNIPNQLEPFTMFIDKVE